MNDVIQSELRARRARGYGWSTSSLMIGIVVALAACNKARRSTPPAGRPAASSAPSAAASANADPHQEEIQQAIKTAQAIRGEQSGDARSKSCSALSTLAENFNTCAKCRAPLIKVIAENPGGDLGDCYLESLPRVTSKVEDVCTALVSSLQKSRYGTMEIGAIETQNDGCKAKFDDVLAHEAKRFAKFTDGYKDVSGAELLYLKRLAEYMTPAQKQKLRTAAKKLEAKAKAKHSKSVEEQAQELATLK